MSFLPLSLPAEEAFQANPETSRSSTGPTEQAQARRWLRSLSTAAGGQDQKIRRRLRIDPHRCEASGKGAAAFFRCNPDGPPLFARLVADFRRGHVRLTRFAFGAQALKETADEPSKPEILRREILHLHHRRKVESAEAPPPTVESSRRHCRDPADFGDGHASARLMEQMKNFAFSESGPSHRDRLMQLLARDHPQSQLAAIPFAAARS
jgi:hypothetical protein